MKLTCISFALGEKCTLLLSAKKYELGLHFLNKVTKNRKRKVDCYLALKRN